MLKAKDVTWALLLELNKIKRATWKYTLEIDQFYISLFSFEFWFELEISFN